LQLKIRPIRAIGLLTALALAAILLSTAFLLWDMRIREQEHARLETANLATMFMQQTEQSFDAIDLVISGVQERMQASYGSQFTLDSPAVHLLLAARASGMQQINALFIVDALGRVINSSREHPVEPLSVADRRYFKDLAEGREQGLVIDRPVISRVTRQWTLNLARRLNGPDGSNGNMALDMVRARDWDLVVLDLSMPGRHGMELIKLIRAEKRRLPILIFSMHQEEQYAVRAIRAGANGYLSKESNSDLLLPAMRKVAAGGAFISPKVAELLATDVAPRDSSSAHTLLTDREYEVFSRIVHGDSLTAIADELCLSIKTVSTHKSHILTKMNLASHVDLVRYALEHKLLDPRGE
jgi:DNA-binding NarL/FixJ family response regulator